VSETRSCQNRVRTTAITTTTNSTTNTQSQSQSYFTTSGLPPISSSWCQAPADPWRSNFIFQLNTCDYSPYVTFSLTKGWFCHLQLLLALASAVILRSECRGTHDLILECQVWDSPSLEHISSKIVMTSRWDCCRHEFIVRQSTSIKDVNMETDEYPLPKAITRRPVN
jgi:hypothetical protein